MATAIFPYSVTVVVSDGLSYSTSYPEWWTTDDGTVVEEALLEAAVVALHKAQRLHEAPELFRKMIVRAVS